MSINSYLSLLYENLSLTTLSYCYSYSYSYINPHWNSHFLIKSFLLLLTCHEKVFFNNFPSKILSAAKFIQYAISSVQSLSCVRLFATPWIAAHHASLSITNSWSLPKLMSIESVMPSSHLILCRPLLLLPPNPSQHQSLFQWVNSSHEVAKVLEFQLQHQSFQWTPRTDLL